MTVIVNPPKDEGYRGGQQHDDKQLLSQSDDLLMEFVYADKLVQILWRQLVKRIYGVDLLDRDLDELHLLPYDVRQQLYDFVKATWETLRKTIMWGSTVADGFTREQDGALALQMLVGLACELPQGRLDVEIPSDDLVNAAFRLRQLCTIKVYK